MYKHYMYINALLLLYYFKMAQETVKWSIEKGEYDHAHTCTNFTCTVCSFNPTWPRATILILCFCGNLPALLSYTMLIKPKG
jgi:hypothetical protein